VISSRIPPSLTTSGGTAATPQQADSWSIAEESHVIISRDHLT
jgi:hypothetical protein